MYGLGAFARNPIVSVSIPIKLRPFEDPALRTVRVSAYYLLGPVAIGMSGMLLWKSY